MSCPKTGHGREADRGSPRKIEMSEVCSESLQTLVVRLGSMSSCLFRIIEQKQINKSAIPPLIESITVLMA